MAFCLVGNLEYGASARGTGQCVPTVFPHPPNVNPIPLCQFLCANSFVHMFAGAVAFGGACPGPVGEAAGFDFSLAISPPRARQKQERTCPHNFRRPVEVNERCRRFSGRTFHPLSASTFLHHSVQENKHPSCVSEAECGISA